MSLICLCVISLGRNAGAGVMTGWPCRSCAPAARRPHRLVVGSNGGACPPTKQTAPRGITERENGQGSDKGPPWVHGALQGHFNMKLMFPRQRKSLILRVLLMFS